MNRQGFEGDGKSGIEWLKPPIPSNPGFTWNPVDGCTNTHCEVRNICWARRMAKRQRNDEFLPRLHHKRMQEPLDRKTPAIIGTCLMGDLFSEGVSEFWIYRVLSVIQEAKQHIFVILTKNPQRLHKFRGNLWYTKNLWVGTSISNKYDGKPSTTISRLEWLRDIRARHKVLSIEPLREPINFIKNRYWNDLKSIDWIFIGGQTNPTFYPKLAWIRAIIDAAHDQAIPVLVKDNAGYSQIVREWPETILTHLNGGRE